MLTFAIENKRTNNMKRLKLEHEAQTNEKFASVTEQTKNEVRSKVINHITDDMGYEYRIIRIK